MKELTISEKTGKSRLVAGAAFADLWKLAPKAPSVLVVDDNVKKLHASQFKDLCITEIPGGEASKNLKTLEFLYNQFLSLGLDRSSHVVAVGGGSVCDVTAFAAATYMRGLTTSLVPTTLLAQIDAGIGGKNGINFSGFKNILGTIRQPALVLCDPAFLKTLPSKELRNGYAEAIKHGATLDRNYFEFLQSHVEEALSLEANTIERVIYESIVMKAGVVSRDELEDGERVKLNFGHTVGHAIESVMGYSHGEAVSIGMVSEAKISVERGLLRSVDYQLLVSLLEIYGLPTQAKAGKVTELKAALFKDKKRIGNKIRFTLLESLGTSRIEEVSLKEIEALIENLDGN